MLTEEKEQQAGSSSATAEPEENGAQDIDAEALDLLGQGKRNLVVGDPPAAVQCLQEACELLAAKYGEMADECGEAYFRYGCALLELASMENGVLGNALQGVPNESADSDSDDDENTGKEKPSTSNIESADGLEDDDEDAEPDTTEGGEKSDQKEDADDIPNFQLAWEMLELARVILSRNESEEFQLKVSQIHLKLGELGLETEQYVQSIVDFTSCLEIQKKYLDPESRLLAGTHYNLGLAYTFAQKYDRSIEHYNLSKQLIEARLATLEKRVSEAEGKGKEKANEDDPLFKDQKEVDELKELLPDIVSKLEDAKEMKLQGPVGGESSDGAGPSTSSSSGFAPSSSSSAPIQQIAVRRAGGEKVQDASHLVKRKNCSKPPPPSQRKPEEGDAEPGTSAETKRSRQEEEEENVTKDTKADSSGEKEKAAVNGAGDAAIANGNGQTNGDTNGETLTNGDGKLSPEKPSEIKTKKLPTEDSAAAMETA
ncbi:protein HGV2-like [Diadema antillarum]|uniref:protein HGV2-like n=1 Tax=Diadema antillarum TaxID=105358 RepID=UPI003A89B151